MTSGVGIGRGVGFGAGLGAGFGAGAGAAVALAFGSACPASTACVSTDGSRGASRVAGIQASVVWHVSHVSLSGNRE